MTEEIENLKRTLDRLPESEEIPSDGYLRTLHRRLKTVERPMAIEELKPRIEIFAPEEEKFEKFEGFEEIEEEKMEEFEILEIPEEFEELPEEEKLEEIPGEKEEILEEFEEIPEELPEVVEPFRKGDYILHTKEASLRGERKQKIYFFSKEEGKSGTPCELPEGYEMKVSKTGLPYLRKK